MREKIVLIGAGSASFTQGLVADLLQRDMEADVALVDVDPAALEVAERLTSKMISARRPEIGLTASVDRRDVLPGATAVICTVGVGGRRESQQRGGGDQEQALHAATSEVAGETSRTPSTRQMA